MSGFSVDPAALRGAAGTCDRAAEQAAGVLASVRGAGVPSTGRPETAGELGWLLDRLQDALDGLGRALTADADALTGAADRYASTDRGAAGR